jgi:hypothetical protein
MRARLERAGTPEPKKAKGTRPAVRDIWKPFRNGHPGTGAAGRHPVRQMRRLGEEVLRELEG